MHKYYLSMLTLLASCGLQQGATESMDKAAKKRNYCLVPDENCYKPKPEEVSDKRIKREEMDLKLSASLKALHEKSEALWKSMLKDHPGRKLTYDSISLPGLWNKN